MHRNATFPMSPPRSLTVAPSQTAVAAAARARAFAVLPVELLATALALASPRTAIPRACSQLHSVCSTEYNVGFAWRNAILLGTCVDCPFANAARLTPNSGPLSLDPQSQSLATMLALLLSLRAPECDKGVSVGFRFAPTRPPVDPFFNAKYLAWLFTRSLLPRAARAPKLAPQLAANALHVISEESVFTEAQMLSSLDVLTLPAANRAFKWWAPVTTAFIVTVYCLCAGQLDFLGQCLQFHSVSGLSELLLPWGSWRCLFHVLCSDMDRICHYLNCGALAKRSVTFPMVLARAALLEWSLPSLKVILGHCPSLLPSTIAQSVSANDHMMYRTMVGRFERNQFPDAVERITHLHKWLIEGGMADSRTPLVPDLVDCGAPPAFVVQVLVEVDLPFMCRQVPGAFREGVSAQVAYAIDKCDSQLVLETALQHNVISQMGWVHVLSRNVAKWWPILQQHVPCSERLAIVTRGLFVLPSQVTFLTVTVQSRIDHAQFASWACAHVALDCAAGQQNKTPTIIQLIQLLQVDLGVKLLDILLTMDPLICTWEKVATVISSVEGHSDLLPNPHSSLTKTLAFLEHLQDDMLRQYAPLDRDQRTANLFALTAVLYHMTIPTHLRISTDLLDEMPPVHQAILVLAVLSATGSRQFTLAQCRPCDRLMAVAEALVAYICPSPFATKPSAGLLSSVFDVVPLWMCSDVADWVAGYVPLVEDEEYWSDFRAWNCRNADYPWWMLKILVRLDVQFVAATVTHDWDTEISEWFKELVPDQVQECAKVSRHIVALVADGQGHDAVAAYWKSVGSQVTMDVVVKMVRWTTSRKAAFLEDDGEQERERWMRVQSTVEEVVLSLSTQSLAL